MRSPLHAVMTGAAVLAAAVVVMALVYASARQILDGKRAHAWDADWVATDERWSGPKR
ncbi:hypothetical protein J5X84_43760 [Streptosporangiaceae bacterium NEAU-GS5]|nr:hypothetical protein [Streptosporangiaceae bacterium NEAU-GS5]